LGQVLEKNFRLLGHLGQSLVIFEKKQLTGRKLKTVAVDNESAVRKAVVDFSYKS
jgi:hypothetical protein